MSAKHYEYRVVEVTELSEMERQLTALGSDGWAAVGPRVRCFAIEDSLMHLVDRRSLDGWMRDPVLAANVVRVPARQSHSRGP